MNQRCPFCDLRFEREPGYFLGAMYFAYLMGLPTAGVLILIAWYVTRWTFWHSMALAMVFYLPLVPAIFRYSRVLWLHWDRAIDPDD